MAAALLQPKAEVFTTITCFLQKPSPLTIFGTTFRTLHSTSDFLLAVTFFGHVLGVPVLRYQHLFFHVFQGKTGHFPQCFSW
jgi:hypothetical protein